MIDANGGGKQAITIPAAGLSGLRPRRRGSNYGASATVKGIRSVPRPVYSHGMIFTPGSGFDSPVVYAIKPRGATGDATATNTAWTIHKGAPLTPSMLVVGDDIYFVSDGGIATCADVETGAVHWTHRLDGDFSASPVFAEGRIYFQSES